MTEDAEHRPSLPEVHGNPRKHRRHNLIANREALNVINGVVDHLKAFYGGDLRVRSRDLDENRIAIRILGSEADLNRLAPFMKTYQQAVIEGIDTLGIEALLHSQIRIQVNRAGLYPSSANNQ